MPILTLAPMAGVSNWVFRLICARLGARLVGVEFINCRAIGIRSRKSLQMLDFSDAPIYADTGISLLAAQIYGNDIDLIANGAREFERRGAQVVDINFGCSVPKIVAKGCGAAYLRDLDRLYQAVERTVKPSRFRSSSRRAWAGTRIRSISSKWCAGARMPVLKRWPSTPAPSCKNTRGGPTGTGSAAPSKPPRCPSLATATCSPSTTPASCSGKQAVPQSWSGGRHWPIPGSFPAAAARDPLRAHQLGA